MDKNLPEKSEDLLPNEWQSDRPKPREPFFGSGLPFFFKFCLWFFAAALFAHYVMGPLMQR